MKKYLLALCMASLVSHAQPYGEKLYPHPGSFCSSGAVTGINTPGLTGFLTSGLGLATSPTINFYLDKTGPGGVFGPAAAFPFSNQYIVYGDIGCSTGPGLASTMFGIDAIEVSFSAMGGWYAIAGAFDQGSFFALLDNAGNVMSSGFYPFPLVVVNATRPVIVQSPVANEYFICGSYQTGNGTNTMYVNNVYENGALTGPGSRLYDYPGGITSILPADMIISPYTPVGVQELVIAGQMLNAFGVGGLGDRGFMLRLDINTLNQASALALYGQAPFSGGSDGFGSITSADPASNGGGGFVIGGHSDINPGAGFLWTLKTDPTGFLTFWNTLTQPITDPNANDVIAVRERQSAFYGGSFEYYCAVTSASGMMVIKLDDNGVPFTSGIPVDNFNEFIYYGGFAAPASIRDLSLVNNGNPTDVGIHVYGTDDAFTGGNHYFVEAAFNGVSFFAGCPTSKHLTGAPSNPGPTGFTYRDVEILPGLIQCPNFYIQMQQLDQAMIVLCNAKNLPPRGSNDRMAQVTGIDKQEASAGEFRVSPNPVTDRLEVIFTAMESDAVEISLYDYLGRFIQSVPVISMDAGNAHMATLNLSTLDIESGVYIIRTRINGVSAQQKIIYTKGR